jgi:hypothetical protein
MQQAVLAVLYLVALLTIQTVPQAAVAESVW